jgi:AcrR family transcriptional regulator
MGFATTITTTTTTTTAFRRMTPPGARGRGGGGGGGESAARQATRRRLLDAAFELFTRHGFHAIGLDRVIADAGVSKQTFYNHFDSKDALVLDVLRQRSAWELRVFVDMIGEFGGADPRDQLRAIWDVLDAWFNRDDFRGCIFLTAAAEFPSHHDPAHEAAAAHASAVRAMLAGVATAAGARDPERLAEHLLVLIDGALVVRHITGLPHSAELGRRNAELLLEQHLPKDESAPEAQPSPTADAA